MHDLFIERLLIFFTLELFSKINKKSNYHKQQISWFKFTPLLDILKKYPDIKCQFCQDKISFNFKLFPLSIDQSKQPNQGILLPTFILTIPNGIVQGMQGFVFIQDEFIEEMVWRNCPSFYRSAHKINPQNSILISGKVAVITQVAYENYFHWMTEILCRLALLEKEGIEYDYIYVPQKSKFMKETLKMWGIPEEKIIAPVSENFAIKADEIILPSLVSNSNHGWTHFVNYVRPELLQYVKNKLFLIAQKQQLANMPKKIFISRKDAPFRKILNEDEVFAQFEPYGFVRYELSKLPVVQQIMLFHQAEIIVSPQGTGLANSIFCTTYTKIIELFQGLGDCTFWYISQIFNLNYTPIQTIPFEHNFFKAWQGDTYMPTRVIEDAKKYF